MEHGRKYSGVHGFIDILFTVKRKRPVHVLKLTFDRTYLIVAKLIGMIELLSTLVFETQHRVLRSVVLPIAIEGISTL